MRSGMPRVGHPMGHGWAAARWAVDQATALGASVIYLEDLTTLETRGHRRGNARLSGQVRGTVAEAIRHLAAKAGLAVVTVPARGTSRLCPGCLNALTHHPAPDRLSERGWKWAHCAGCGLSMDRDHAAARRIVSRGLLAQTHTTTERTTGTRTIHTTVEGTVTLVRRPKKTTRRLRRQRHAEAAPPRPAGPKTTPGKGHPTPTRLTAPRHRTARRAAKDPAPGPARDSQTPRRMPDVRTVPATTPTGVVQRPAGHDTTTPAACRPVPGHAVPAPRQLEDLPRPGRVRLSRRTCRRRTRAPSGPASTTCTPPKSTPSPRGSDHPTATAHGHAAPEKPGNHRHTQSSRDALGWNTWPTRFR
ncbi:zinc ribbon domain-containing protein [Streptomyces sp. ADMS]|uniref:zinc ribbon domain-containing protein n=1 Tax=Streptomyces sp. ADMS TaxID=3071415 RepID=UPI00296F9EF1|nr:zinc ribbon domain-containing protein [Streptomyces sp. ADMS]MDW4906460.1 zinc ribbon domain-containing protein [Streptomyces sp. ADMS]